jgi:hypothetical protein
VEDYRRVGGVRGRGRGGASSLPVAMLPWRRKLSFVRAGRLDLQRGDGSGEMMESGGWCEGIFCPGVRNAQLQFCSAGIK